MPASDTESGSRRVSRPGRPTALFDRPDPVERIELDPTGAPEWFRWRGESIEVLEAIGPERIGSEWWRQSADREDPCAFLTRDYYRVQSDRGRWLWLFCEGGDEDWTGRWFVHGEWR